MKLVLPVSFIGSSARTVMSPSTGESTKFDAREARSQDEDAYLHTDGGTDRFNRPLLTRAVAARRRCAVASPIVFCRAPSLAASWSSDASARELPARRLAVVRSAHAFAR